MNKQERADNRGKWIERVSRWKASGLTATKFAAGENVNADTLRQWSYRLVAKEKQHSNPVQFVEIGAHGSLSDLVNSPGAALLATNAAEPIEIILQNGMRIRLPIHFDAASLRRAIEALENR